MAPKKSRQFRPALSNITMSANIGSYLVYINQKNCPVSIFKFSIKNDFLPKTLALPKNYIQIFKNEKLNATSPHTIYYISSIYFFHKIFVPSEIWWHFYIHTLFFLHFQIWTFWPQKPKHSNLINSFLTHYPQPKMNWKSPKDPESNPHLNHETAVHSQLSLPWTPMCTWHFVHRWQSVHLKQSHEYSWAWLFYLPEGQRERKPRKTCIWKVTLNY